jgi:flagellin
MVMQIGTNVASMVAQRSLNESSRDMSVAMERLATGLKINSASDDAAGLAISTRMEATIGGLNAAEKNIHDGLALTSADILQRMRSLAVQAASDTITDTDRVKLNTEMTALKNELTAMSTRAQFNGQTILDGTFTSKQIQVGDSANETIAVTQTSIAPTAVGAFTINGAKQEVITDYRERCHDGCSC